MKIKSLDIEKAELLLQRVEESVRACRGVERPDVESLVRELRIAVNDIKSLRIVLARIFPWEDASRLAR